jgi:molybdate transport system regulatory protein
MNTDSTYAIKGHFWVMRDGKVFLGEGRCSLLERIDRLGSIRQAAQEMNMSYRKAWKLVASMNKQAQTALVEKQIGGTGGGGTRLTPYGREAILSYRRLSQKLQSDLMNHVFYIPETLKAETA